MPRTLATTKVLVVLGFMAAAMSLPEKTTEVSTEYSADDFAPEIEAYDVSVGTGNSFSTMSAEGHAKHHMEQRGRRPRPRKSFNHPFHESGRVRSPIMEQENRLGRRAPRRSYRRPLRRSYRRHRVEMMGTGRPREEHRRLSGSRWESRRSRSRASRKQEEWHLKNEFRTPEQRRRLALRRAHMAMLALHRADQNVRRARTIRRKKFLLRKRRLRREKIELRRHMARQAKRLKARKQELQDELQIAARKRQFAKAAALQSHLTTLVNSRKYQMADASVPRHRMRRAPKFDHSVRIRDASKFV